MLTPTARDINMALDAGHSFRDVPAEIRRFQDGIAPALAGACGSGTGSCAGCGRVG